MNEILKIWIPCLVAVTMSLYLYDLCMHRVFDILISAVCIVVTSPMFAVLAVLSKIKKGHVFIKEDGVLKFSYPGNRLVYLARLLCVFVGKRRIVPERLRDIKL